MFNQNFYDMKFNYKELNKEFQTLLKKHGNDTEFVSSADKKIWEEYFEDYSEEDKEILIPETAVFCNSYLELCHNHDGLQEVSDWSFGADEYGYSNPWDVFVEDIDVIYGLSD